MSKYGVKLLFAATCMVLILGCSVNQERNYQNDLLCNTDLINAALSMPKLGVDSSEIRKFEERIGSRVRMPGRRRFIIDSPKAKHVYNDSTFARISELFFGGRIVAKRYRPSRIYHKESAPDGGELVPDGLDIARPELFWLPIFYRPRPMNGLNMVVMHQLIDSMYYSGKGWWTLPDVSVVKLYSRDAVLDSVYPELQVNRTLDRESFALLFNCLQAHFDSLSASGAERNSNGLTTDLGAEDAPFRDKAFKHLIRHHAWLAPDSVAIELYCYPADRLRKYMLYDGGAHSFVIDSASGMYLKVANETVNAKELVYDIQWEDLAIWIVYTHIGKVERTPYEP